jgi:3-oxosteroid 1-dehydrogenase
MSLVGQLTKIVVDAGIPLWLATAVEELILEDGRVVGVRAKRNGLAVVVRGERGVLLSVGGFERNPEMRLKFSADTQPSDGTWTMANMGNTGEVLSAAIAGGQDRLHG